MLGRSDYTAASLDFSGSRETSDSELSRTNLRSVPRLRMFLTGRGIAAPRVEILAGTLSAGMPDRVLSPIHGIPPRDTASHAVRVRLGFDRQSRNLAIVQILRGALSRAMSTMHEMDI